MQDDDADMCWVCAAVPRTRISSAAPIVVPTTFHLGMLAKTRDLFRVVAETDYANVPDDMPTRKVRGTRDR